VFKGAFVVVAAAAGAVLAWAVLNVL